MSAAAPEKIKTPPEENLHQKAREASSNNLILKTFGETERKDYDSALDFFASLAGKIPPDKLNGAFGETSEARDILFRLNPDALTFTANLLYPLFEAGLPMDEAQSLLPGEYEKILRCFGFFHTNLSDSRPEQQSETIRQIVMAANLDIRVVFILLARRTARLRRVNEYPREASHELAEECLHVFAPIAHRLGFFPIKNELETEAFRILQPENHKSVLDQCSAPQKDLLKACKDFGKKMHQKLEEQGVKFEISFREKLPYSIFKKAKGKGIRFDELSDLVACRIITHETTQCYRALGIIHGEYHPLEGRFKDYIAAPKPNGYQSLHTTLITKKGDKFEVQIRTREMHEVSEKGIAAHWAYKKGEKIQQDKTDPLLWVRELSQKLSETNEPGETFNIFNRELYSDSIYVFSPKGTLYKLPKNATLIDFAYAVHSDVGNQCNGGKINGVIKPIRTVLKNGDQVEIILSKNASPNSSWLEHTVTNKAQYNIRQVLRERKRLNAQEVGKQILFRELKKNSIPAEKFEENPDFLKYCEKNNIPSFDEYLFDLGFGSREVNSLINSLGYKKKSAYGLPENFFRKLKLKNKANDIIGTENLPIRFAKCCQAVQGDEIVGLVSNNGMINVHRKDCQIIKDGNADPRQKIDLQWSGNLPNRKPIKFEFVFPYEIKTFNKITKLIESYEAEIIEANLKNDQGTGVYLIVLDFPEQRSVFSFTRKIESLGKIKCRKV